MSCIVITGLGLVRPHLIGAFFDAALAVELSRHPTAPMSLVLLGSRTAPRSKAPDSGGVLQAGGTARGVAATVY